MKYKLTGVLFVLLFCTMNTSFAELSEAPPQVTNYFSERIADGGRVYDPFSSPNYKTGPITLGQSGEDTVVLYVNGILTDRVRFESNIAALKKEVPLALNASLYGFYNASASERRGRGSHYSGSSDTKYLVINCFYTIHIQKD